MIKISAISDLCKEEYRKTTFPAFKKFLDLVKDDLDYKKEIDYLSKGGQLDDDKITVLLTGDISKLEDAIKGIGEIQPSRERDGFRRLYKNFINRNFGKAWADSIGVTTCPYCNRSYIYTLKKSGVRPQYDHFFPQSLYPYLALSMYNLIPCCAICNQAKGYLNTYNYESNRTEFIYPYTDSYGETIRFQVDTEKDIFALLGNSENFKIKIVESKDVVNRRVENSIKKLNLQELYNKHKDYVQDIIKTAHIYNNDYFLSLLETYPDLFKNIKEAEDVIYINYLNEEDWGKRVLSKLTHDIRMEFQN